MPDASAYVQPTATATPPPAPSAPTAETLPEPPTDPEDPLVVWFEAPYKMGSPRRGSPELFRQEQRAMSRWNQGGREGRWHPEPRVIVDNTRVQGAIAAPAVQREVRKNHYWAIRRCYDPALRGNPTLSGKMRVQFTVKHSGTIRQPKPIGRATLGDPQVVGCLARSFSGLKLPQTSRGDATVSLDITLHPGDLPPRDLEEEAIDPGPGSIDGPAAQALLAAATGDRLRRCYEQGRSRVAGLWGRMVLRARISGDGAIGDVIESESTFPDPGTTTCVIDAVRQVALSGASHGELYAVIPIRFGIFPE